MMLPSTKNSNPASLRLAELPACKPIHLPNGLECQLYQRLQGCLNGRDKRQLDFETGRYCASQGLQELGLETEVRIGRDRCPVWPRGSIGSISHSENFAWSVVGRSSDYRSLGIDTEPIADELSLQHLYEEIVLPTEDQFAFQLGLNRRQAFTAIFSAKESFYKCAYQIDRQFFGFHDVRITRMNETTVHLKLQDAGLSPCMMGREMAVAYDVTDLDVFTACWLRKSRNELR